MRRLSKPRVINVITPAGRRLHLGNLEAYDRLSLLYGGLALATLAWIWLIVRAFQEKVWWGLASLLLPPLALVFALRHAQKAIGPLVTLRAGRPGHGGSGRLFPGGSGRSRPA